MSEEYRQKLDNNIGKLIENFGGLIKSARIRDKCHTSREGFQTSVHATSLVQASEALLKMIAELKISAVLGDFSTMNSVTDRISQDAIQKCNMVHQSTEKLCEDLTMGLYELENHFYASRWRVHPDTINE